MTSIHGRRIGYEVKYDIVWLLPPGRCCGNYIISRNLVICQSTWLAVRPQTKMEIHLGMRQL